MARPKTFDRSDVLTRAMEVFWDKGFEQTSIEDLVRTMGISRASLYDTFGSKDALMFEAMDCYVARMKQQFLDTLRQPGPARTVIEQVFLDFIESGFTGDSRGCLVAKSALMTGRTNREIMDRVCAFMSLVEDSFHELVARGQRSGELPSGGDPRAIARFLVNALQGLSITGCARAQPDTLRDVVAITLSVLG
ncbi:MAG: TetR/AcrR family transcriptional regulator [Planctomycetes bacterium]|nr:TetR/AcrR family transcriptional regulator [Planctomycetota bacterium]